MAKEIEDKYAIIDKLYKAYQAEQVLLTEEMKNVARTKFLRRKKDVKDLQKQRFGYEGDLFKKKQEMVKPIQDKIYNAVKKLATDQSYAVIFDKSSDLIMLYANPKYDKSDDILLALGFKPAKKNPEQALLKEENPHLRQELLIAPLQRLTNRKIISTLIFTKNMMKKSLVLACVAVLLTGITAFAQTLKFGHIDSGQLIQMMPQTKQADSTLKNSASHWIPS